MARRLLADPNVPVEAVRDYAVGPNWFYSCAGLAALCDRDDRDEALDTVVSFFDNLTPWGLHFGLSLSRSPPIPRPPVGVPLLSARDYWRDNMFVITAFREYLDKRASARRRADFGAGIDAATPEARETIKAVLARINHPLAAQLIESLDLARLTNIDRAFLTSFGRFWRLGTSDVLIEPESWTEALAESESQRAGSAPARSYWPAARIASARRRSSSCSDGAWKSRAGPCSRLAAPISWRVSNGSASSRRASSAPSRSWPPPRRSSGTSPTFCRSR